MSQIAFIGLGNMGGPMAKNLLKSGHHITVFDLSASALEEFTNDGANISSSAIDAVRDADIVISMLPASRHVEALYLGNNSDQSGLLPHIKKGALIIDCSTIAAQTAIKVAKAAAVLGLEMLDAPVSGGTAGSIAGTLTFIVGGDDAALQRAHPLLSIMGKNIFHAGPAGAGQVAKVCNNQLLAVHMIGTAEAMALGVANGLDPATLAEIMRQSSGGNWSLEKYNPWPGVMPNAPASKGYSDGFAAELMTKDLGLAQEAAQATASSTPMGALALQLYRLLLKQGQGKLDFSAVQKLFVE